MTRIALITTLACWTMTIALFVGAFRRLGIAWFAWRARTAPLSERRPGKWRFRGRLEPAGSLVSAPFTERAVVYAKTRLRGEGPEGGSVRVLWRKILTVPVRLCERETTLDIDLANAMMLIPREYRIGSLRGLIADVRVLPRVLSRAGYKSPPPANQWFHLEEEVLEPGEDVTVIAERDASGALCGVNGGPIVVSNLSPFRIALRVAWGPVLAIMLGLIIAITGATVLGTYYWLR